MNAGIKNLETFEVDVGKLHIVAYKYINGRDLVPGDMYIAKRNTGWHLAKCLYVNHDDGWVMPDPPASIYSYDCHECYKVMHAVDRFVEIIEDDFGNLKAGDTVYDKAENELVIDDVYFDGDLDCLIAQDVNGNHWFVGELYRKNDFDKELLSGQ